MLIIQQKRQYVSPDGLVSDPADALEFSTKEIAEKFIASVLPYPETYEIIDLQEAVRLSFIDQRRILNAQN